MKLEYPYQTFQTKEQARDYLKSQGYQHVKAENVYGLWRDEEGNQAEGFANQAGTWTVARHKAHDPAKYVDDEA